MNKVESGTAVERLHVGTALGVMGVVVDNETVGRRAGVFVGTTVGIALCVSVSATKAVLAWIRLFPSDLPGSAWVLPESCYRMPASLLAEIRGHVFCRRCSFFTTFNVYKETLNASHLFQRCSIRVPGGSNWWAGLRIEFLSYAGRHVTGLFWIKINVTKLPILDKALPKTANQAVWRNSICSQLTLILMRKRKASLFRSPLQTSFVSNESPL